MARKATPVKGAKAPKTTLRQLDEKLAVLSDALLPLAKEVEDNKRLARQAAYKQAEAKRDVSVDYDVSIQYDAAAAPASVMGGQTMYKMSAPPPVRGNEPIRSSLTDHYCNLQRVLGKLRSFQDNLFPQPATQASNSLDSPPPQDLSEHLSVNQSLIQSIENTLDQIRDRF